MTSDSDGVGFWAAAVAHRKNGWDGLRGPIQFDDGVYRVTRREDVVAVLGNHAQFASNGHQSAAGWCVNKRQPFDVVDLPGPTRLDPPEQDRFRKVLRPLLSADAVTELLPVLTAQAAELVAAVAQDGECDAVAAVVAPFAVQTFLTFCGLPLDDRDAFSGCVSAILNADPGEALYLTAVFGLFGYLTEAVAGRREDPSPPGALSGLVRGLSDPEAVGLSMELVTAGIDSPAYTMLWALVELARQPDLRALLRGDPGQVSAFVEEIIRLYSHSPGTWRMRASTADVAVGGVEIPAKSAVAVGLGAVNREEGNEIIVRDRQIVRHPHVSFGVGPHRCPAAHLSRMQLIILVEQWLNRIPDFELSGRPESVPGLPLRWSPSLPLRWEPVSRGHAERKAETHVHG